MGQSARKGRTITVFLVEGHPLAAQFVASALQGSRLTFIWKGTEIPFERLAKAKSPVIVVDAGSLRGLLSKFLHLVRPRVKADTRFVVVDTSRPAPDILERLSLGIHGFVSYERVEGDLGRAIRCVAKGNVWAEGRKVAEAGASPKGSLVREPRAGQRAVLTSREGEVAGLVARRLSNKEIASALGISERTVKFHLGNVFAKLGVHNRYSAAELASAKAAIRAEAASAGQPAQ